MAVLVALQMLILTAGELQIRLNGFFQSLRLVKAAEPSADPLLLPLLRGENWLAGKPFLNMRSSKWLNSRENWMLRRLLSFKRRLFSDNRRLLFPKRRLLLMVPSLGI